jgi:hypothetical protein
VVRNRLFHHAAKSLDLGVETLPQRDAYAFPDTGTISLMPGTGSNRAFCFVALEIETGKGKGSF